MARRLSRHIGRRRWSSTTSSLQLLPKHSKDRWPTQLRHPVVKGKMEVQMMAIDVLYLRSSSLSASNRKCCWTWMVPMKVSLQFSILGRIAIQKIAAFLMLCLRTLKKSKNKPSVNLRNKWKYRIASCKLTLLKKLSQSTPGDRCHLVKDFK